MRPGDKVIYFKSYNFDPAPARIGYVTHQLPVSGWVILTDKPDGTARIHVRSAHVHRFTDDLWAACKQWECNAQHLEEQHKRLMTGRVPEELAQIGMW
jgi:hypothetical protein